MPLITEILPFPRNCSIPSTVTKAARRSSLVAGTPEMPILAITVILLVRITGSSQGSVTVVCPASI